MKSKKRISLIVELWLVLVGVILVSLVCAISLSVYHVKSSFSEQLQLKNVDNANTLALSLSQLDKHPVTVELFISAAFDTGHYQQIKMLDVQEQVLVERAVEKVSKAKAPRWFTRFVSLNVSPGVAKVSDGWQNFGTLYVQSQQAYAIESLWQHVLGLCMSFVLVALGAIVLISLLLRWLLKPLKAVEAQAMGFTNKRFVQLPVPRTLELANVTLAMNYLAQRFSDMLKQSNEHLRKAQHDAQHDAETGLVNAPFFAQYCERKLEQFGDHQHGLLLLRVKDYEQVSEHGSTEALAKACAATIISIGEEFHLNVVDAQLARISFNTFALFIDDVQNVSDLVTRSQEISAEQLSSINVQYSVNAVLHQNKESYTELLERAEQALVSNQPHQLEHTHQADNTTELALRQAIEQEQFQLHRIRVDDLEGQCLHEQVSLQIMIDGQAHDKRYFKRLLRKLNLSATYDWKVFKAVFAEQLWLHSETPIAIELSKQTLDDEMAYTSVLALIASEPQLRGRFIIELSERLVTAKREQVSRFCQEAKQAGCLLSLQNAGRDLVNIADFEQLGIDIVKLDNTLVYNLERDQASCEFVRHLCSVLAPLGVQVIAEELAMGVSNELLAKLGVKGRVHFDV